VYCVLGGLDCIDHETPVEPSETPVEPGDTNWLERQASTTAHPISGLYAADAFKTGIFP
jgi:hypothetical protein